MGVETKMPGPEPPVPMALELNSAFLALVPGLVTGNDLAAHHGRKQGGISVLNLTPPLFDLQQFNKRAYGGL